MRSYDIRMQKSKSILRYRSLKKIAILFRFMDIFIFLTMISTFSAQLPAAVNFSGHHFIGISISSTNFSPMFAFVTGNAIILLLLFKSRLVENGDRDDDNRGVDFYGEYFKSYEMSLIDSTTVIVPSNGYKICRSRSEDLIRVKRGDDETYRKLRRSVTERRRLKNVDHRCDGYAEDKMSGEEFRRTVEAFIARQQKSLRDEEFSPVVYVGA